jgi:hypothetical protein
MDEVDAEAALREIAPPRENDPIDTSDSEDSFSGGRSVMHMFEDRSFHIYTRPDGQVWQARLTMGIGSRCGRIDDEMVARFVSIMAGAAQPDAQAKAASALTEALAEGNVSEKHHLPGARFTAAGDCVQTLNTIAE